MERDTLHLRVRCGNSCVRGQGFSAACKKTSRSQTEVLPVTRFLCAALLTATFSMAGQPAQQSLTFTFGTDSIEVSGLSRGGTAYIFSISREIERDMVSVMPRGVFLDDADQDGRVTWTPPRGVALRSMWLAVDFATGAKVFAVPPEYAATPVELGPQHLRGNASIEELSFDGDPIQAVVIRPGIGAWRAIGWQKTTREHPMARPPVVAVHDLKSDRATEPHGPGQLRPGDIVFLANSATAEYGLTTIGARR